MTMHAFTHQTRMLVTMIAMAATTGIATTSYADNADAPRYDSVVVTYADLNLDTIAGNQTLYARLSNAASRACGGEPATRDLESKTQYRACVEDTLNRAVDKISSSDQSALREIARKHSVG
ncbi:MAG: UrcA family protein [Gammaproteobacteria bacterium]|nr:UrcA family protein [Gammaproteobacteria bacterium]MDH5176663.1 UrcA family protein [Gammaproteobacteria bacterium]